MPSPKSQHRISALAHWEAGQLDSALADAWKALDEAPDEEAPKALVARLLHASPESATIDRQPALRGLLNDRDIEPGEICVACWRVLLQSSNIFAPDAQSDPTLMAQRVEASDFCQELLRAAIVVDFNAEMPLTRLRRWLLLSERWRDFPRLLEALVKQAELNGGAWVFDSEERAHLDSDDGAWIVRAYRRAQPAAASHADAADAVTRAVAEQYESWPYPQWTRITLSEPRTLPDHIEALDPGGPNTMARDAHILIAGCGTGRQIAQTACRYPDAWMTAIDFSEESLRYAKERCGEAGLSGIEFRKLDLHRAGELDRQFDAIFCTGVLHHLPDPEKGWAALADVLKPGGVMRVMVYSTLGRLRVRAMRSVLTDLLDQPVNDDLLREARRRIIARNSAVHPKTVDFFSLAGVHDLLLHRHEDPFDVPRIRRALDRLGLNLLRFELPDPPSRARYKAENPHDPLQRDFAAWANTEKSHPFLFAAMYDFWCRKPIS